MYHFKVSLFNYKPRCDKCMFVILYVHSFRGLCGSVHVLVMQFSMYFKLLINLPCWLGRVAPLSEREINAQLEGGHGPLRFPK